MTKLICDPGEQWVHKTAECRWFEKKKRIYIYNAICGTAEEDQVI